METNPIYENEKIKVWKEENPKLKDEQNAMVTIEKNEIMFEARVYNIDNYNSLKILSKQNTKTQKIESIIINEVINSGEKERIKSINSKNEKEYKEKIETLEKLMDFIEVRVITKTEFEEVAKKIK